MKQEHGKRANKALEQAVRSPELAEKCIWNCAGATRHTRRAAGPEPWEGTAARWAGQGRRVWGEQGNEGNKVSDEPWRRRGARSGSFTTGRNSYSSTRIKGHRRPTSPSRPHASLCSGIPTITLSGSEICTKQQASEGGAARRQLTLRNEASSRRCAQSGHQGSSSHHHVGVRCAW